MPDLEFDVAISFLSADESLALELADKLREHVGEVFVYSEAQKDVAATDGLETFRGVFYETARVVVVLYRNGWGETKWTGVEEDAIKDRGLEAGWEGIVVVAMDSPPDAPKWLPRTYLWVHFDRFGLDGLVPVVVREVQKHGGSARSETAAQRAERLARQANREQERRDRRGSIEGVHAAGRELATLFEALRSTSEEISAQADGFGVGFREIQGQRCIVWAPGCTTHLRWAQQFGNTLEYSQLQVRELDGHYDIHLTPAWPNDPVHIRRTNRYDLELAESGDWIWSDGSSRHFSSGELAEHVLRNLIDRSHSLRREDRGRG